MTLALSKAATCRSNTAGRREITVGLLHWPPISSAGRLQSLLPIGGDVAALAAKAATSTLPVVFTVATDPVRSGLVSNLHRPGGNLTGNSGFQAELEPKRLGLLRELRPDATTIGVLVNPNVAYIDAQLNDIRSAAADIGGRS